MKAIAPSTRLVMFALRIAAVSTLLALALMVWGVLDPQPIALVIAMSVGQALGTLAFATFCAVVSIDLIHAKVLSQRARRFSDAPPEER